MKARFRLVSQSVNTDWLSQTLFWPQDIVVSEREDSPIKESTR